MFTSNGAKEVMSRQDWCCAFWCMLHSDSLQLWQAASSRHIELNHYKSKHQAAKDTVMNSMNCG